MYRDKTIIHARLEAKCLFGLKPAWKIMQGTHLYLRAIGISRLFRLISTLITDKKYIYSIDIIVKRRK